MGKLVQIELCDFKSYRDQQIIGPFKNFSSICGPNGAGKSNLMDAISFVLGIKSSHLRSTHLKDLIYKGSDGNSSSAPNTAWVSALYEDDAGKRFDFKRTITSQGASEYRIDNRVVSAQTYNSVLESHNILIKARNFLVFQGDVEAIASQSPKDLTKLIEQISGSLEYKAEYDRLQVEQEKATENSTFNFHQKRSINSELKQYQDQKKEADDYENKVAEREQALLNLILWKLYHLQASLDASIADFEQKSQNVDGLTGEITQLEKLVKDAEKDRAKVFKALDKRQRQLKKLQSERQEKLPSIDAVNQRIKATRRSTKTLKSRLQTVVPDVQRQENIVKDARQDLATIRGASEKFEQNQAQLERDADVLSDADLQEYRQLKDQYHKAAAGELDELMRAQREVKGTKELADNLEEKISELERRKATHDDEIFNLQKQHQELEIQVETLTDDLAVEKQTLDETLRAREEMARERRDLNEKLQEVLEQLQQYSAEERETQKELRTKENVIALKRIFPGVRGRLTDLCRPTQRKFDTALATVLGRNIDAIVVDTEKTAKECIEYMREQRSGIATFLPLDILTVRPVGPDLRSIHRQARLAIDVVNYEAAIERAVQYACSNTLICDDLNVARQICYQQRIEVKAVTIDGTIIHKSGNLTGGQHENRRNTQRWTDAEVEGLRRLRDSLMTKLNDLAITKYDKNDEEVMTSNIQGLEERLGLLRNDLEALSREMTSKQTAIRHIADDMGTNQADLDTRRAEQEDLEQRVNDAQRAARRIQDRIFRDFCRNHNLTNIRVYEEKQDALTRIGAQKRADFVSQLAKLQNHLSFEEATLEQLQARVEKMEAHITRDEAALTTFEQEAQDVQAEIDRIDEDIVAMQQQVDDLKQSADSKSDVVNEHKRAVAKVNKDLDELQRSLALLEGEKERLLTTRHALLRRCKLEEIDLPLLRGSLDRVPLEDTLNDQPQDIADWGIEIDFEELDDDLKVDESSDAEASLNERLHDLETDLERMNPNTKAIERLEGVESRLHTTEKEFERARKDAKRAREKFNVVHRKRMDAFTKAFDHITNEIDGIYKDLTKSKNFPLGGTAYLSLEDSEEPFNGGIKYHAMPPMKRFRDMDQLSGGEKTMAALALLFAIHSYQPAPFFVLDEVDAALDNANVSKIANYLTEHAKRGDQFVVISLKNALFHQSDGLVGVYRDAEAGSSKTLTLDLGQYQ